MNLFLMASIRSALHRSDSVRPTSGTSLTPTLSTPVPNPSDVLKYFHEEPALLEPVTPDADPDARRREDRSDLPDGVSVPLEDLLDTRDVHRGYLAGTNHADDAVGLTTLRSPDAYAEPLLEALGGPWWARCTGHDTVEELDHNAVRRVLRAPTHTTLLVTADAPVAPERITAVAGRAPRRVAEALRALLGEAGVVIFPEPAHDGHDWSIFSAAPMRDRLVAAFRAHPASKTRRFVLPYQKARSESKFYFDEWQLTDSPLPDYIEEV